jgi:uridine phosphorylase
MVRPPILDSKPIPSPSVFPFGQSCFGRADRAGEMEAAALYAFARAAGVRLLCLAHVTNTMGQSGDEKGERDGTSDALAVLDTIVRALAED